MVTVDGFRDLALAFEEAQESPHFHLTSFRIRKKIFATLDIEKRLAMIALSPIEQSIFIDGGAVRPVPGGWGAKGATHFELDRVGHATMEHAVRLAYCAKAPRSLAQRHRDANAPADWSD